MKEREELETILNLLRKYNLPLSPILEYAIQEKMEGLPVEEHTIQKDNKSEFDNAEKAIAPKNEKEIEEVNIYSSEIRIVENGLRSFAVIGNTKPHKDCLKAMGGHFTWKTQWGPAWIFFNKKRERVQAYLDGDTSVVNSWEEKVIENPPKKTNSRYIIRVVYPNGKIFESNKVWETLVDVIKYAGPKKVSLLNILCMGENLVSPNLNENPTYRAAQKDIGGGLYVCTYSSTETKFKQIEKINNKCNLGLKIEKIYSEDANTQIEDNIEQVVNENNNKEKEELIKDDKKKEDKRIGYKVRIYPTQLKGEIIRTRIDKWGAKKLIIKTGKDDLIEIDDLPYLYEVLKKN